jgi:DNA polymerase-3 subunit delta'
MSSLAPSENPLCLGHDTFITHFQKAQAQGRLAHGWLLWGPQGVGKRTAAYNLIRQLFSGGQKLGTSDPLFRRIANESHGDFFLLKDPHVEAVRGLSHFLRKAPVEGLLRLVLIPDVDHFTINASNALLKILEEPAPHTFFFLTAQNQGRVLPTVRSRCRIERLFPSANFQVFAHHLQKICEELGISLPSAEEKHRLWDITKGCLGNAARLLNENTLDRFSLFKELMERALLPEGDPDFQMPFHSSHGVFWASMTKEWFGEQLLLWVQDLVIQGSQNQLKTQRQQAIFSQRDVFAWGALYDVVCRFLREAQTFNLETLQTVAVSLSLLRKKS